MKIAFYKHGGNFYDTLIRWFTKGKYSHCEIIFDKLFLPNNLWFTSSPRDRGVRFKYINPTIDHWDFIDLNITLEQEQFLFNLANIQIGRRYNWIGIARFIIPILPLPKNKWFCSQICAALLKQLHLISNDIEPEYTSPEDLYDHLVICGHHKLL